MNKKWEYKKWNIDAHTKVNTCGDAAEVQAVVENYLSFALDLLVDFLVFATKCGTRTLLCSRWQQESDCPEAKSRQEEKNVSKCITSPE